ncbi:hypothetical protein SSYRP_v1c00340 [Spiroplasma syrphidicola EA-1]|uniref:Uncharacterized protein n=1 Tax=Spiroplasma syrphidicola EA-1 TaxID=1276229 RepID=R4UHN9_9MOLU|nr:hypothetical protein [Spiroplasma syrphidicola]AGM25630.1 hypothetical protein SSYRP_v1c00340 [Spiroplasma syrphidicola EA-1]
MATKLGLNAKVYILAKPTAKEVVKLKGHFVENLPINSKLIIFEEVKVEEGYLVVANKNVFKVSQRIIAKHPVRKTFESYELRLTLVDQLNKLPKIEALIATK